MKYDFRSFLKIVRKIDGEVQSYCPFHNDRRPSFSANTETGLWICHAGCGQGNFNQFLELIGGYQKPSDRQGHNRPFENQIIDRSFRTIATYQYMDTTGVYHLRVTRQENQSGEKRFFQEHLSENGYWIKGGATKDVMPYLIHEWSKSESPLIFFVEGEKCVEFLRAKGLNATTIPGGANKWRPQYANYFSGKRVVVLPDNDSAGGNFAHQVYCSLREKGDVVVSKLLLPGVPDGGDVVDWLSQNRTVADLLSQISSE